MPICKKCGQNLLFTMKGECASDVCSKKKTNKKNNYKIMKKVLKERKFEAGYIIKTEELSNEYGMLKGKKMTMKTAYTPEGHYIGNSRTAYRLCKLRGIKPELSKRTHKVCSVGFSDRDNKWYGWSHRAIFGFGIGRLITKKVSGFSRLKESFKIKTLAEAREVAIKFANSVS